MNFGLSILFLLEGYMIKSVQAVILVVGLVVPGMALASSKCDTYHEAIMACTKQGCDTTIDDFSQCLVEEQGISEYAEDGTNEVEELVSCFHSEYSCN